MFFGGGGKIRHFDDGPGAVGFGKSSGNPDRDAIMALQECGMEERRANELVKQFGWRGALERAKFERFESD